jgi:hypothetical protein
MTFFDVFPVVVGLKEYVQQKVEEIMYKYLQVLVYTVRDVPSMCKRYVQGMLKKNMSRLGCVYVQVVCADCMFRICSKYVQSYVQKHIGRVELVGVVCTKYLQLVCSSCMCSYMCKLCSKMCRLLCTVSMFRANVQICAEG